MPARTRTTAFLKLLHTFGSPFWGAFPIGCNDRRDQGMRKSCTASLPANAAEPRALVRRAAA